MAISQKPVETKNYVYSASYTQFLLDNGYLSPSDNVAFRSNIFASIPHADSAFVKTEHEVIGNELMARGFWMRVSLSSAVAPTAGHYGANFRLTVYSIADVDTTAPTFELVGPADRIYDPDFNVGPYTTDRPFNMQQINVLKTHSWEARFDGNEDNYQTEHRMWVPIMGRKVARNEESSTVSSNFGPLKGRNYYWLLEIYAPGQSDLRAGVTGAIMTKVYFKDA